MYDSKLEYGLLPCRASTTTRQPGSDDQQPDRRACSNRACLEVGELGFVLVLPPRLGDHEGVVRPVAELRFGAVKHLLRRCCAVHRALRIHTTHFMSASTTSLNGQGAALTFASQGQKCSGNRFSGLVSQWYALHSKLGWRWKMESSLPL